MPFKPPAKRQKMMGIKEVEDEDWGEEEPVTRGRKGRNEGPNTGRKRKAEDSQSENEKEQVNRRTCATKPERKRKKK